MRAAVLLSKGPPSALNLVDDYPKPQLGPQHVLLRIKAIGKLPLYRCRIRCFV